MATYISQADIKDNIVTGFDLDAEGYLDETDTEIVDLAEQFGIDSDDIENTPLHYKVKRYAVVFCLMRFCQDKAGTNNTDLPELEKYIIKYKSYEKEYDKLRGQISYSMLTGQVDEMRDRVVNIATIFRA